MKGFKPGFITSEGGINPDKPVLIYQKDVPLRALPTGEWVTFGNNNNYKTVHPKGWYDCENTIEVSADGLRSGTLANAQFYGWTGADSATLTALGWYNKLLGAYNMGLMVSQQITLAGVPGYVGYGVFLDLATIGMGIFDLRSKPEPKTA